MDRDDNGRFTKGCQIRLGVSCSENTKLKLMGNSNLKEVGLLVGWNNRGRKLSKDHKENISKSNNGKHKYPYWLFTKDSNKKRIESSSKYQRSIIGRECRREITKLWWSIPDNAKLRFKQMSIKPNKLELGFQKFLDEHFPGDWKYVGDGEIWIAGKCPDFLNVNGKKQIIELYGSYWHKPEDEELRKSHFWKHSYKTLIIWDYELRNPEKVISKIQVWGSE
jgi:hypothetical protein